MKTRLFAAAVVSAGGLLAGCATSPPMQFYVLAAVDRGNDGQPPAGGGGAAALRINRVTIPGEIDRPQLMRQVAANQLQIYEQDRWAGPLDEMIRRVLAEDLERRAAAATAESQGVSLEITQFVADANCAVILRAEWRATGAGARGADSGADTAPRRGTIALRLPAQGTCPVSAIPGAMSTALEQLSGQLLRDVANARGAPVGPS